MTIKKALKLAFILISIASLAWVPWRLVKAWILPLPNSVEEQMDEAINQGFDGAIVCIEKAGQSPKNYAAGWHNKEKQIPAYPQAFFKIASISKLYNAVAICKLAVAQHLNLDSSLAYYLPHFNGKIENASTISVRMLVQHKSGIPNFTETENYWAHPAETNADKLELILGKSANFMPGTKYEYCNTNYVLLSEIMDSILENDPFDYIQSEILIPLGLKNTFSSIENANLDSVMSGYHLGHPFDLKMDKQGMLASAEDVAIFLRALNNGSLLNAKEQALYTKLYELEHKGWVPGYQSIAKYHADLDAVIVLFTSTTDPDLYNWNLADIVYSRIVKIVEENEN